MRLQGSATGSWCSGRLVMPWLKALAVLPAFILLLTACVGTTEAVRGKRPSRSPATSNKATAARIKIVDPPGQGTSSSNSSSSSSAAGVRGLLGLAPYRYGRKSDWAWGFGYICDQGLFLDADPAMACRALGYGYGRLYYNPSANVIETPVPAPGVPSGGAGSAVNGVWLWMGCSNGSTAGGSGHRRRAAAARRLLGGYPLPLELAIAQLDFPLSSRVCGFDLPQPPLNPLLAVPCARGPFVGVECSASEFTTPATTRPLTRPRASPPPPRPPDRSTDIQVLKPPELNLCPPSTGGMCRGLDVPARVEVKLAQAGGKWAPLCWPDDAEAWDQAGIATLICRQRSDYPYSLDDILLQGELGPMAFPLPAAAPAAGSGGFDPTQRSVWASLPAAPSSGGIPDTVGAVQDLGLAVSSTPCRNGLLSVICSVIF